MSALASPAMGHWGTCFFSTFGCSIYQVTSEPHKLWHWLHMISYSARKQHSVLCEFWNISSAVITMSNFIIFFCVILKLFSLSFVPPRTKSWRCHCTIVHQQTEVINTDHLWTATRQTLTRCTEVIGQTDTCHSTTSHTWFMTDKYKTISKRHTTKVAF